MAPITQTFAALQQLASRRNTAMTDIAAQEVAKKNAAAALAAANQTVLAQFDTPTTLVDFQAAVQARVSAMATMVAADSALDMARLELSRVQEALRLLRAQVLQENV